MGQLRRRISYTLAPDTASHVGYNSPYMKLSVLYTYVVDKNGAYVVDSTGAYITL